MSGEFLKGLLYEHGMVDVPRSVRTAKVEVPRDGLYGLFNLADASKTGSFAGMAEVWLMATLWADDAGFFLD